MKVLSSFLFTLLISIFTMAQDNSIEFIDNDFAKAKEAAKKSGKLIFADAYTTWCGPCKWMAANKFTNDTIAEFYNKNFISLKMDMEKGDGKEMAKSYNVRAYPTLLFLDAEGNLVHRKVGASRKNKDYTDLGLIALNPYENLAAYNKVWEEGDRSAGFVKTYLNKLGTARVVSKDVVSAFYANLNEEQLMDEGTWNIISRYDKSVDSKGMVNLLAKKDAYIALYGQEKVEKKLYQNYLTYIYSKVNTRDFSMKEMELTMIDIKKKQIPYWQKIILLGDLAHLQKTKKYKEYCEVVTDDAGEYFNEDAGLLNRFAWNVFEWSDKNKELEIALAWAKRSLELQEHSAVQDTYANLLNKLGRKNEAIAAGEKALEMVKKEGGDVAAYEKTLESFKK